VQFDSLGIHAHSTSYDPAQQKRQEEEKKEEKKLSVD